MQTSVQLAADWRGAIPEGGLMAEQKFDGWRAARFPGVDGQVRLWTRNGMTIEGAGHILYRLDLMERAAGVPMMFDGEFQVDGTLAATKAWCERGWKAGGESGVLHLFDAMPLADWRRGGCDVPLYQRKARLIDLARAVDEDPALSWEYRPGSRGDERWRTSVHVVPDDWCMTARDVIDAARRIWAAGGEGCMIKDAMAPYQRRRSDAWQKVKQENQHKWRLAA